jgi:RNA polymerase sigma-70 factor (ECF subfamily)
MKDGEAISRVLSGDVSAFEHLVERYYDHCLRYATSVLGNRQDGEEVVQDAFVRAFRGLRDYEHRDRFEAWLFRIVVNRCRTKGAATSRRREVPTSAEIESMAVARHVGDPLTRHAVRQAVASLPPDHREAFLLKYVEGFDYNEMAHMTGASISALKMRVSRARSILRSILGNDEEKNDDKR